MSTILYAALSQHRKGLATQSQGAAATTGTGLSSYVDALAALVPAEVLTLHAVILTFTTAKKDSGTIIEDADTLYYSFFGCILMTLIIYAVAKRDSWDLKFDIPRMFIPALAFVGWTMIQRTTAFDAVFPDLPLSQRTAIGIFAAALLGIVAAKLAQVQKAGT